MELSKTIYPNVHFPVSENRAEEVSDMGKLIVLSLDESERNIYDKILEIVNEADISIEREVDANLGEIQIGELNIIPEQHKVLRQGKEINLTNIEFRILYMLAIHKGITLSKEKIYNYVWNGEYLQDDSNITSHVRRLRKKLRTIPASQNIFRRYVGLDIK